VEISETWRWLIQLVIAAFAVGTAAWFYLDFAPRLRPDVTIVERDHERGLVVLRLTVENVSRVLVHQVADGCRLQVVARPLLPGATYEEFVPLTEDRWREEGAALHLGQWREPRSILRTTSHWYPGDRISVDHLVRFPVPDSCLHVALQVRGRLPWYVRILMGARAGRDGQRQPKIESWTTTVLVLPETSLLAGPAPQVD
jgi:hypothetical protein